MLEAVSEGGQRRPNFPNFQLRLLGLWARSLLSSFFFLLFSREVRMSGRGCSIVNFTTAHCRLLNLNLEPSN